MMKKYKKGKKLTRFFSYINNSKELLSSKSLAKNAREACDLDYIQRVLEVRSCHNLEETTNAMNASKASSSQKTNEIFAP